MASGACVVALSMLAACIPQAPPTSGRPIAGAVTVVETGALDLGDINDPACTTTGSFADITEGTRVVVKDGAGKVLDTAQLGRGTQTPEGNCAFPFTVVVPDADVYVFSAGTMQDGVTISRSGLKSTGGHFDVRI